MIYTRNTPTLDTPVLIDQALAEIGTTLLAGLSWLDKAYGKCQRLVELGEGGQRLVSPFVYVGAADQAGEYLGLFPDESVGNFCFFDMEDNESIEWNAGITSRHIVTFGLIFWFDFREVYPVNHLTRTAENVKADVLQILHTKPLTLSAVRPAGFVDRVENIYAGFNHREIEKQFLMRPFGGFRLNGELRFDQPCI